MSLHIKIWDGTAKGIDHLCPKCKWSHIWEDRRGTNSFCRFMTPERRIQGNVPRCTSFYSRDLPHWDELKEIAWEIKADPKGRLGFHPPEKKDE